MYGTRINEGLKDDVVRIFQEGRTADLKVNNQNGEFCLGSIIQLSYRWDYAFFRFSLFHCWRKILKGYKSFIPVRRREMWCINLARKTLFEEYQYQYGSFFSLSSEDWSIPKTNLFPKLANSKDSSILKTVKFQNQGNFHDSSSPKIVQITKLANLLLISFSKIKSWGKIVQNE